MRSRPLNIANVRGLADGFAPLVDGRVPRANLPKLPAHDPREYAENVTIGTFGAIPSGTVHDNNATAIALATDGAQADGGELFLPGLLWASTDAIVGNDLPVAIRGNGRMSGIATADTSGTLVDLVGSDVRLQNLRLFGPCDAQPGTTPSTFTTTMLRIGRDDATLFDPQILGVEVLGGDIGMECVNVAWLRAIFSTFQHFRTAGVKLTQLLSTDSGDAFIQGLIIHGPNASSPAYQASASGLWLRSNSGTRISGCKFYCRTDQLINIDITEGATDSTYPLIDFVVDDCHFDSGQLVAGSAAVRAQSVYDGVDPHDEEGSRLIGLTVTNSEIFACEYGLDVDSDGGAFAGINYTNIRSRGGAAIRITGSGSVEGLTIDGNDIDRDRAGISSSTVSKFLTVSGPTVTEAYIDTRNVRGYGTVSDIADTAGAIDLTEAVVELSPVSGTVTIPVNTGAVGNTFSKISAAQSITWDIAGDDAVVDGASGVHALHYSTASGVPTVTAPSGFTIHVAKKEDNATDKAFPTAADNLHVDIVWRVSDTRIFYDIVSHGAITGLTTEGGVDAPDVIFGADLVGWWKADDQAGADGSDVTSCTDSSGNGRTLTGSAGSVPVIRTGGLNGKKVFEFDGTNDSWAIPSLGSLTGAEVYVVIKLDTDPPASTAQSGLYHISGAVSGEEVFFPYTNGNVYENFGSAAWVGNTGNPSSDLSTQYRLYNVTAVVGEWTSRVDGVQHYTIAGPPSGFSISGGGSGLHFGKSMPAGNFLDGRVAEWFIINRAATTGERSDVNAYLNDEYALSLP